ncbi:MAG TPA: type III-B CRISPR module RAMP protein Cmr4 [Myxococcota bacterium]|nr:type III-B CRISPR module RAMP protein Cmr4 [Myxococcota bacterium]
MSAKTYFLHALTPLHPGTGQGHGLIDLPVARDVSTNHPVLYGSSLKGVLRDAARAVYPRTKEKEEAKPKDPPQINWLFGPESSGDEDSASPLRLTDARLLLLPVRSDKGTFAWVTCPLALRRLARDKDLKLPTTLSTLETTLGTKGALVAPDNMVASAKGDVTLAELRLSSAPEAEAWAERIAALLFSKESEWKVLFKRRFVIVSDDTFTWLAETATEVRAQIRVDPDTGTVATGALWYSEVLPAESVLAGTCEVLKSKVSRNGNTDYEPKEGWDLLQKITTKPIQVGGKATTGLGQVRVVFAEVTP